MAKTYNQLCALAFALDLIGDRWSLLIIRNLILGPLRFGELKTGLPGIASNLLSNRLSHLVESDLIEHDLETAEYALTETGESLIPPIFALADWGEKNAMQPTPSHTFRLRYAMTSVYRHMTSTETSHVISLRIDGEWYSFVTGGEPYGFAGEAAAPDVVVTLSTETAVKLLLRHAALKSLKNEMIIDGDENSFKGFLVSLRR